jgi:RRNA methyltransferase AviRa
MDRRRLLAACSPGEALYIAGGREVVKFSPFTADTQLRLALTSLSLPSSLQVYDPFCGNGVIPCVVALSYSECFERISASDILPEAVGVTGRNLAWLTRERALQERLADKHLPSRYHPLCRALHQQASRNAIPYNVFIQDALELSPAALEIPTLIVTDPPYGADASWRNSSGEIAGDSLEAFLRRIAALPDIVGMALAYTDKRDIRKLLERYMGLVAVQGSRKRTIYLCQRRTSGRPPQTQIPFVFGEQG